MKQLKKQVSNNMNNKLPLLWSQTSAWINVLTNGTLCQLRVCSLLDLTQVAQHEGQLHAIGDFDKKKLKHTEVQEKNVMPDAGGESCFFCGGN